MNELPSSAMGALRLMPAKSNEINMFSNQLIQSVKNGETNPLELLVILRALEAVSKLVREKIEGNILTEADKYRERIIEAYGAKIEKAEVSTTYNYAYSKDAEWEQLDAEITGLLEKQKKRQEFLRSLTEPITVVNRETGEISEIRPPSKTSKSGVKVFLK